MTNKKLPPELAGETHLLVIFPHPDDESFGTAGVMAMLRQHDIPVTYVCATDGQMGRHMGRPPFANRETLPSLRRRELAQALEILQVENLRRLGLWDKTVEFEDRNALAQRIYAIVDEIEPSTVITFHPLYGAHPDHNALGDATLKALARLPVERRPRVWCPVVKPEDLDIGLPVVKIDISAYEEQKLAAFRAHRSQTSGWDERLAQDAEMQRQFARLFQQEVFWEYPLP